MNKNLTVNKLTVKSFRGINHEISLDLHNITILKGENGTGKSSFVNAIEYLFSDDLSFLKNKTINSKKSTVNRNCDIKDVFIELKFKKKRFIKLTGKNKEYTPVFNDILKNHYIKNASFILNRKKLLKFIDGTQGNRYDAIMELCGIKDIDKIQSALSSSSSTLTKELNKYSNDYNDKLSELSILLTNKSNLNFNQCIEEINRRLEKNNFKTINDDTNLEEFIKDLDLSVYGVISNKINEFKEIYENFNLSDCEKNLNSLLEEYENIASDNLKSSQSLLKLLIPSKEFINLTKTDKCPVCDNDINPDEILLQMDNRINQINESNSSYNNWKKDLNSYMVEIDNLTNNCDNFNRIIKDLNDLIDINLLSLNYDFLNQLKDDLNEFLQFNKVPSDFRNISFDLISEPIEKINNDLLDYSSSQNIDDLNNIYNILFKIIELNQLKSEINDLRIQRDAAVKTFNVFTKTKEEFINKIINDIKKDIKVFYEYIHGDDLINSPDIKLSGSKLIDVYLNSFGDLVDSRSYASEGHLDTLGICIFLAFNKKFNEIPLIVLDDVLATVDLPHKERIGRLIVDKLSDYQFFITTHSPLWSEQLKRLCISSHRDFMVYELINWSFEEGPITAKPLDAEEKIIKYLGDDNQDFKAAGNTARRYLESILTDICVTNNVKVPINDKYDVNTLFEEVKKFTEISVNGTSLEGYYKHILSELDKTRYLANILSHHNDENDLLPKSDVEKFCEDVINLKRAFTCDCGKSTLKIDSKSKKLICSNEKCRDAVDMNKFEELNIEISEVKS